MSEEKTKREVDEVGGCFIGEPRTATVGKGKSCGSDPLQQRVQILCGVCIVGKTRPLMGLVKIRTINEGIN